MEFIGGIVVRNIQNISLIWLKHGSYKVHIFASLYSALNLLLDDRFLVMIYAKNYLLSHRITPNCTKIALTITNYRLPASD